MPELAYFFGLRWEHIEVMPPYELDRYVDEITSIRRARNAVPRRRR